ncbi:MAG TPA: substrate-binding domain-containing protein [Trebonia sp.]|jgi:simple sugar transport system substrate-binding protein|nr:substrate-binding domain-containing protein [Trebonia sp.]
MKKVDPVVDEAIQTLNMKDGPSRRRLLGGAGLFSATAAASALISACSSSSSSSASTTKDVAGNFPTTPKWQFWFVNHADTNEFFTPTQYGFQDAAALLGLPKPNWGGDPNQDVANMVSYFNEAIAAKAGGIATTVPTATGFTSVVKTAMDDGIPVVSYNADGVYVNGKAVIGTNRLAYVGQALYISGQVMGSQIAQLVPNGGKIGMAIAQPGAGNIQPRLDGAASVLSSKYQLETINTTTDTSTEQSKMEAWLLANKDAAGLFAVDSGSTSYIPGALKQAGGVKLPTGGFDTAASTLTGIQSGALDFTIFQDPYQQGFLPVLYLYLYNLSGAQLPPSDTDTGLTLLKKDNLTAFSTNSRFQGNSSAQMYIPRKAGPIDNPPATTST